MLYEVKFYKYLQGTGNHNYKVIAGIPKVHWYGTEGEYNVMVMDLLGPSLEDLLMRSRKNLSLKTVLLIADQAVLLNHNFSCKELNMCIPKNLYIGILNLIISCLV